jgi:hypothetical protein
MIGYPQQIINRSVDVVLKLEQVSTVYGMLLYREPDFGMSAQFKEPRQLEMAYTTHGRPEIDGGFVQQGKFECVPAAIANVLKTSMFEVRRALAAEGWRNDDYGCSTAIQLRALRNMGIHAAYTKIAPTDDKSCIVCVPSLNYPRALHAIGYDGEQMIDSNWGYKGRRWWGTEWKPRTIDARDFVVICDSAEEAERIADEHERFTCVRSRRKRQWEKLCAWRERWK